MFIKSCKQTIINVTTYVCEKCIFIADRNVRDRALACSVSRVMCVVSTQDTTVQLKVPGKQGPLDCATDSA
jgi:hypothetical protein